MGRKKLNQDICNDSQEIYTSISIEKNVANSEYQCKSSFTMYNIKESYNAYISYLQNVRVQALYVIDCQIY